MTGASQRDGGQTGSALLLRTLGLGDFLTGIPAYRAVRRAFPQARVVLAAPAGLAGLVPATGAVDELLPTGQLEPIRWSGRPPDVAIDLHGRGPASHDLVAALHPGRLVVFGGLHRGGYPGPEWLPDEHEAASWRRLCAESAIPADSGDLHLDPSPGAEAARWLWPDPPTLVHPGAGAGSRRWPAGRYAAVARRLAKDGRRVLITGSAAERELALGLCQLAELPPSSVLAGGTSLAELAAITARARLVVCGDTGMCHLAAAYRRPLVALYGPTPPTWWGPPAQPGAEVLWAAEPGDRGDPHGRGTDPAQRPSRACGRRTRHGCRGCPAGERFGHTDHAPRAPSPPAAMAGEFCLD